MKKTTSALFGVWALAYLFGCGDSGPCFELRECCDALARTSTVVGCSLPFNEEECQLTLDMLPDFARPLEDALPPECPQL